MPDKFVVPQFIDTEDKILGPITVRQFLILLGATFLIFIEYKLFTLVYFIFVAFFTGGTAAAFAFLKINGQPFHIFFVNFLQTSTRPKLRVWHKELSPMDLKALLGVQTKVVKTETPSKSHPSSTRLRDLALTVNTGGVYNADSDL